MQQASAVGQLYRRVVQRHLTWWISSQGLGLTFWGESMPVELSGAGLHGDYISRRDGWEWPNDGDLAGA